MERIPTIVSLVTTRTSKTDVFLFKIYGTRWKQVQDKAAKKLFVSRLDLKRANCKVEDKSFSFPSLAKSLF